MNTATSTEPITNTEPTTFVVWQRERKPRARWKKIATVATRAEAVALMTGSADYHVAPLTDERLAGEPTADGASNPSAGHD